MKKLVLLALLLLAPSAFGQSVGASQIKKRSAGGLVADSANALTVAIYRGTSAPNAPIAGMVWCDTTTTPCSLKTYSGSAWSTPPNTAIMTQANLSTFPANPTDGQIVWVSSQARAIVYDATAAKWFYLDDVGRQAGADYSINTTGYPATPLSSPGSTTGTLASGGSMTTGAHSCAVTHYSSTGGETLPGGTYTDTTTGGNLTMALTFAATGTNVAGKRIYCSKAGTTTPLFLVTSIDDTTTGTYSVTIADSSFGTPAAPDVDFSAPLPSGWTFSIPDRSYGGCGSTPTGLLCSMLKASTGAGTIQGPRLYYSIVGTPTGWRASWKVTRLAKGFTGSAGTAGGHVPLLAWGVTDPAGDRGLLSLGQYGLPFSVTTTPALSRSSRAVGAAGVFVDWGAQPWPPITTAGTLYLTAAYRYEGTEHSYRFGVSANGWDFAPYPVATGNVSNQRSYTTGLGSASFLTLIGVALETPFNGSDSPIPFVVKISDFYWASE